MDSVRARNIAVELIGKTVGGWAPTELIGNGKSALVLKATKDGQKAVLKIFDPELVELHGEQKQKKRIEREKSLIGEKHDHLIGILDGGKCAQTGYLYIVMEFIDAPTLSSLISDFPTEHIRSVISKIALAAQYLESHSLAHRDIKPDNIVVTPDYQNATLLDLGVIRPFGRGRITDTNHQSFVGTLQYSSPEFLTRDEEHSTDGWRAVTFYQLGAVLHDMIMKKPIFNEYAVPSARLVIAIKEEIAEVSNEDVPHDLVELARNCLVKDPTLRLKLVSWDDFRQQAPQQTSVAEIRKRIIQSEARAQCQGVADERRASESEHRAIRQKILEFHSKIVSLVRIACSCEELFPPAEYRETQGKNTNIAHLKVILRKSPDKGLMNCLVVHLTTELLDRESSVIQIKCAPIYCSNESTIEIPEDDAAIIIFSGVFNEDSIKSAIDNVLYLSFANALISSEELDRGRTGSDQWYPIDISDINREKNE
ncbi:MAG: hypothetical protein E3J72_11050 [Planctomycetota bacterium]|nr:MAG: hypothetical protein E3J72_11050 [Planctomycetota bacterium]